MENKKKCSSKKHPDKDAKSYCPECQVYMCNQCEQFHSDLLGNHNKYDLIKEKNNFFSGFCQEEKHKMELNYFCRNHNQLCCAACICKIKNKEDGQHADCEVCEINQIKEEKKSNLKKNIQILEDYSKSIDISIDELKNIYEKMVQNKEELQKKILSIFTKIRTSINEREDEILKEIENIFGNLYFKEDLIKQGEKLPKDIKLSLEKGKIIDNDKKENDKLNAFINDCILIENNIKNIEIIKRSIEEYNSTEIIINFIPEEDEEINEFINNIKSFGKINADKQKRFKEENEINQQDFEYNEEQEKDDDDDDQERYLNQCDEEEGDQ